MTACPGTPGSFEAHLNTHGQLTGQRNNSQKAQ